MPLGRTWSAAFVGAVGKTVTVEANVGPGLPGIYLVGLGDTAVREARDRIKTAAKNTGLQWPKTKVIVSLSPGDLPKSGSHFDLPVCLAVLAASREVDPAPLERTMVLGELGLDGSVGQVAGCLPAILTAAQEGATRVIIPEGNAGEASVVDALPVHPVRHLSEVIAWLAGEAPLPSIVPSVARAVEHARHTLDFADVAGQDQARFAAEVAAAGSHHFMMIGPPGSGKSMIAERIPSILPRLTGAECLEATSVHSVAGKGFRGPVIEPPFVAPHHSVTSAALLGGGAGRPRPGVVSLAHCGVLFLDEVSEIPARILDGLRVPLEEGQVRLARSRSTTVYPARFQLILAANPCRCGAEEPVRCRCSAGERRRYLSNLTGPMRDRLDFVVRTQAREAVLSGDAEPSAPIAGRVAAARERSLARWSVPNAAMPAPIIRREYPAEESAMALIGAVLGEGGVSQRGADRVLKVAWTLCDLDGAPRPSIDHVGRALELRGADFGLVDRLHLNQGEVA